MNANVGIPDFLKVSFDRYDRRYRTVDADLITAQELVRAMADETDPEKRKARWFIHSCAVKVGGFGRLATISDKLINAGESLNSEDLRSFCTGSSHKTQETRELIKQLQKTWSERALDQVAVTSVCRKVFDALEYSLHAGPGITLIQGDPRTGKTISAQSWCEAHSGQTRYLELESGSTDAAFFVDINQVLGNPMTNTRSSARMRNAIREVMDTRDLVLVLDEAHWMFGSARKAVPKKINWIMTCLVNRGCSVVLIVTPQFMADMGRFEKETAWAAAQVKGRIVNFVSLESTLPESEIKTVAARIFPEGDAEALTLLAKFAGASPSYLHAIRTAAMRARFLAKQENVSVTTNHIRRAASEQLNLVADLTKATSVAPAKPGSGKSSPIPASNSSDFKPAANRLKSACTPVAGPIQDRSRSLVLQP